LEVLVGEDLMLMCDILDERSIETVNGAAAVVVLVLAAIEVEIVVVNGVAGHAHGLEIANVVIASAPDPDHLRDVDVHELAHVIVNGQSPEIAANETAKKNALDHEIGKIVEIAVEIVLKMREENLESESRMNQRMANFSAKKTITQTLIFLKSKLNNWTIARIASHSLMQMAPPAIWDIEMLNGKIP